MNFIYEGMSPEELAAKRAELESELMTAQFEHEFESVQMMHELRLKDIEKQIILENCSIEKVADLYANEEDLYTEAEGGILTKFFNWLSNIIKAIFGVTQTIKVDPAEKDETIELGVDVKALNAGSKSILQNLRDLTKIRDENGKLNLGAIVIDSIAAIGAVKGIGAFISAVKKKTKLTKGEAKTEADQLAKASADIRAELERINNTIKEDGEKKDITQLTSLVKVIESSVKEIKEKIGMSESSEKKSDDTADTGDNGESNDNNTGSNGADDEEPQNGNKPTKAEKKKQKESEKGAITADDKSKSPDERVDLIVNEIKSHLRMDGNIARCSEAEFKKHYTDRIALLQAMISDKKAYPETDEADRRVYRTVLSRLKSIQADHGSDKQGSFKPFSMPGGKMSTKEVAILNAKNQAGYDPDTNTISITRNEQLALCAYYDQFTRDTNPVPWKTGVLNPNNPVYDAMVATRHIIEQAKAVKGASSDNEQAKLSDRDKLLNDVEKKLNVVVGSRGKKVISASKDTYDQYVNDLQAKIDNIKKANPKDPALKIQNEKLKMAKDLKAATDNAAKTGDTKAWSNSSKMDSSGRVIGLKEHESKHAIWRRFASPATTNTINNPMDPTTGFDISGSEDDDNISTSLTDKQYDAKITAMEAKLGKMTAGTTEYRDMKAVIDLAKKMKPRIFNPNANTQVVSKAKVPSSANGKTFATFMKDVFDAKFKLNIGTANEAEFFKAVNYEISGAANDPTSDPLKGGAYRNYKSGNSLDAYLSRYQILIGIKACKLIKADGSRSGSGNANAELAGKALSIIADVDHPSWMITGDVKKKEITNLNSISTDLVKKHGDKVSFKTMENARIMLNDINKAAAKKASELYRSYMSSDSTTDSEWEAYKNAEKQAQKNANPDNQRKYKTA